MRTSAPQPSSTAVVFRSVLFLLLLSTSVLAQACTGSTGETAATTPDERVERLHAFAKLYGYVRYFHPSDAAAEVDWERFAVHGARVVGAAESDPLADTLTALFAPIAPTVQIFRDGEAPPVLDLVPEDTSDLELVAWQHVGVGLGNQGPYRSARLNRRHEVKEAPKFGTVTQMIDATPYRGFEVRLQVSVRAEVSGAGNQAQAWIRVDRAGRQIGFFDNMQDRAVTSPDWQTAEFVGSVADDAERIAIGGLLVGSGSAFFDDFRLSVRPFGGNDDDWRPVDIDNGGFEAKQDGDAPRPEGWGGGGAGYAMTSVEGGAADGEQALRIQWGDVAHESSGEALFDARPEPGEFVEKPLSAGLVARVPVALYSRDGAEGPATLRPDDAPDPAELAETLASIDLDSLTATDEALRVADVVMAWNVFQHFYPYFEVVDVDWDGVLRESLRRALVDRAPEDFLRTLRWMVAQLGDGHGWVSYQGGPQLAGLPLRLGFVEDRVVITAVDPSVDVPGADCPRLGDVVTSIDGRATDAILDEWRGLLSGSPQWKTVRALRMAGVGPPDDTARLEVDRAGESAVCEIGRSATARVAEARPDAIAELDGASAGKIFYVDLGRVPMADIAARIDEIASAAGVVFDLRGYPQGNHGVLQHLTDEPLQSAHWQVPQQIYPDQERRVGFDTSGRWNLPPAEPRIRGEVAFLTDGRAISYAESVMGIVEHYRLGDIVGSATAGTNGNVNPLVLPGGFRVTWTGMCVLKNDGSQHHLVGIQPTVPAERTVEGLRAGRDEVLEAALAVIRSTSSSLRSTSGPS